MNDKFVKAAVNLYPYNANDDIFDVELARKAFVRGAEFGFAMKLNIDKDKLNMHINCINSIINNSNIPKNNELYDLQSLLRKLINGCGE